MAHKTITAVQGTKAIREIVRHTSSERNVTADCTAEDICRNCTVFDDITAFMELIRQQRFDEAEKEMKHKRREVGQAKSGLQNLTGFSSGFMRTI